MKNPSPHEHEPHEIGEVTTRRSRQRLAAVLGGVVALATVAGAASGIFGHRGGGEEAPRLEPIEQTDTASEHPELEPVRQDAQETIEDFAERIMTQERVPDDNQNIYTVSIPVDGGMYGMHIDFGEDAKGERDPEDARGVVVFMNRQANGNPNQLEQVFRMSLGKAVNGDEFIMDAAVGVEGGGYHEVMYSTGDPERWGTDRLLTQEPLDTITGQADAVLDMAEQRAPIA